jgi:hypothetical protein
LKRLYFSTVISDASKNTFTTELFFNSLIRSLNNLVKQTTLHPLDFFKAAS